MKKTKLLKALRQGRTEWEATLARVPPSAVSEPGVAGKWSLKDLVAHVTWFEREIAGVARARALVGSELWNLPPDERNAAIFEANRDRTWEDVQEEAAQAFADLLTALETLSDEDLGNPARFRDMPTDWVPWKIIAQNSFEHYQQHVADVRAWLDQQPENQEGKR